MSILRNGPTLQNSAEALSKHVSNWLEDTEPTDVWRTCASCQNLAADDRTCSIFGKQPPVSVVVKGCEQYKDSHEMPF